MIFFADPLFYATNDVSSLMTLHSFIGKALSFLIMFTPDVLTSIPVHPKTFGFRKLPDDYKVFYELFL